MYEYTHEQTEIIRRPERKSSTMRREYNMNKSWSRSERRLADISDSDVQKEPDPYYSPRLKMKVPSSPDVRSNHNHNDTMKKKVYQKTRFSADIPLVQKQSKYGNSENHPVERTKSSSLRRKTSSLGDKFRKIIGKFQGSGKNKSRSSEAASNGNATRSYSPMKNGSTSNGHHQNGSVISNGGHHRSNGHSGGDHRHREHYSSSSYHTFGNVDNLAADTRLFDTTTDVGDTTDRSGRDSPLSPPKSTKYYSSYEKQSASHVPRTSMTKTSSYNGGAQTLDRNYRVKKQRYHQEEQTTHRRGSPTQKYYLGEDPYGGSIYGKEKEYDGTKPFRRKYNRNGNSTDDENKGVKSQLLNGVNNIFGGRLSKSTSKLGSDSNQRTRTIPIDYTNYTSQTLPRKSKKVSINDPNSDQENLHFPRHSLNRNTGSLINVSFANNNNARRTPSFTAGAKHYTSTPIGSPLKPSRSNRASVQRSKSFNVQLGPRFHDPSSNYHNSYKSNPQLHKIDESPPPLKSPGIVTSINRNRYA